MHKHDPTEIGAREPWTPYETMHESNQRRRQRGAALAEWYGRAHGLDEHDDATPVDAITDLAHHIAGMHPDRAQGLADGLDALDRAQRHLVAELTEEADDEPERVRQLVAAAWNANDQLGASGTGEPFLCDAAYVERFWADAYPTDNDHPREQTEQLVAARVARAIGALSGADDHDAA